MPPYMNVNWNISVPQKNIAQLRFLSERMEVACERSWAYVYVKEQRSNAEENIRRNDDSLPKDLDMRYNFWVNISNCKPGPKQPLSMQFMVTIVDKKSGGCYLLCLVSCNCVSHGRSVLLRLLDRSLSFKTESSFS